jgi:hypothetical protein
MGYRALIQDSWSDILACDFAALRFLCSQKLPSHMANNKLLLVSSELRDRRLRLFIMAITLPRYVADRQFGIRTSSPVNAQTPKLLGSAFLPLNADVLSNDLATRRPVTDDGSASSCRIRFPLRLQRTFAKRLERGRFERQSHLSMVVALRRRCSAGG